MNSFRESIEKQIKKDITKGITLKEAAIKAGFQRIEKTNIYYLGYGIYQDKALVIAIPD